MKSRKSVEFNERFNKRWLGYAAAAGAAGVGIMAAAPPAKADIIYTPVNPGASRSLTPDFISSGGTPPLNFPASQSFHQWTQGFPSGGLLHHFYGGARLSVVDSGLVRGSAGRASRLPFGAFIGSYRKGGFIPGGNMGWVKGGFGSSGFFRTYDPGQGWRTFPAGSRHGFATSGGGGSWEVGGTGYVGFLFGPDNDVHYGWASVDVTLVSSDFSVSYEVGVTGYAYNTVPNQPILAGQTSSTPEPGTLGLLALGSLGLGFWRRKFNHSVNTRDSRL
jgi:hypothetical protein